MKSFIYAVVMIILMPTAMALDLELTQGTNRAFPIGINEFTGGKDAQFIEKVIKNDLQLSGQFKLIKANSPDILINQWRELGADSVVSGKIIDEGNNNVEVQFSVYDAAAHGRLLLSRKYDAKVSDLRALAHHISDQIYYKLTGEKGIFSTKIAYILVKRNGKNAKFYLKVADVDGHNPHSLLVSSEPIMSPSWSPDGKQIAYVSFEKKRAQVYTVDLATGKRRLITSFPGINGAPAWSPDGKELAVVLSKSGAPKIYSVDLKNGNLTQLTFGPSIDTEPSYAPDGKSILFTSGRGGAPQIYRLNLQTKNIARVTYDGVYNARASYTPNQKQIVMLHKENSKFNIGVQDINRSSITNLTFSLFDESPSVSPNGRLVLYATKIDKRGILGIVSTDGKIRVRLPAPEGDIQEPAWSPYLG